MNPRAHLETLLDNWFRKHGNDEQRGPTHWVVSLQWFANASSHLVPMLNHSIEPSGQISRSYSGLPFIFDSRFTEPRLARLESL